MTVCLDAGHYGSYNRSPAVADYYESEAMWQLHLYLKEELESRGITVKTTRTDPSRDLFVTDRGRAAKGCDVLLSLHSNAVGSGVNEDVDYVAVYHLHPDAATDADDTSRALAAALAPVIAETMATRQGSKVLSRRASTDKNKDGVLNDNYYGVLNGARQVNVPALIIEHSFHTNTRSTTWLLSNENLRLLAKREAEAVAAYFAVSKLENKEGTFSVKLRTLYRGCKGEDVRALQLLLIGRGFPCGKEGADGSFGPATDSALREYQKAKGLAVDGRAGPATMTSILGADA